MKCRSSQKMVKVVLTLALTSILLFACNTQEAIEETSIPEPIATEFAEEPGALPTAPALVSTVASMPQGSLLATVTQSIETNPENEIESCTNSAVYLADVTIPYGTELSPGQSFEKIWEVRNSGTCTWEEGANLVFAGGDQMDGPDRIPIPAVAPGENVNLAVDLTAPTDDGNYSGDWQLQMTDGSVLNLSLNVNIQINVPEEATAVPATVTPEPIPTETAVPAQPIATAPPTPAVINGWLGEYFNNPNLEGPPALVRDDSAVDFNWGTVSPAAQIQPDHFSARWTREIHFPENVYTFFAHSDDGVRVWVDDQLIIDQWRSATGQTFNGTLFLTEGNHTVRVEYYEDILFAEIQVWWEQTNQLTDVGWLGEYFATPALFGPPAHVRNDPAINFNWGNGSPAPGVPSDNFSIRWRGNFTFEEGQYEFTVDATDGVQVFINDELVLDEMVQSDRRTIRFTYAFRNDVYNLRVEYVSLLGDAVIKLSWQKKAL